MHDTFIMHSKTPNRVHDTFIVHSKMPKMMYENFAKIAYSFGCFVAKYSLLFICPPRFWTNSNQLKYNGHWDRVPLPAPTFSSLRSAEARPLGGRLMPTGCRWVAHAGLAVGVHVGLPLRFLFEKLATKYPHFCRRLAIFSHAGDKIPPFLSPGLSSRPDRNEQGTA